MPFLKRISNSKSKWEVGNGKVDDEVGCGNNHTSHIQNPASHFSHLNSFPRSWKFIAGFTLIELLIVISIFALTASLITASYLTFERNQRLKAAGQKIKTDIRFTQNEALSGNKGTAGLCETPSILVGYYITFSAVDGNNTGYSISGDCRVTNVKEDCPSSGSETTFNQRGVSFSQGVKITKITYGSILSPNSASILFRPLSNVTSFWDANLAPPFLDTSCQPIAGRLLGGNLDQASNDLVIELCREKTPYNVIIRTSGDVYESQPTGQQQCTT